MTNIPGHLIDQGKSAVAGKSISPKRWNKGMLTLLSLYVAMWIFSLILPSGESYADVISNRIMGADRYETAVAASQSGWPDGTKTAILASGENYPDALCAAPLAVKNNAPILLTEQAVLNSHTALELKRLRVSNVIIIGGTGVVSQNVENTLALMGISAKRLAGADRYETAIKVAQEVGTGQGVWITTGEDFPDAVSIAPVAAAQGMPVLLCPPNELTPALNQFIMGQALSPLVIVNGSGALSDQVVARFANARIIGGSDRYERNVNILTQYREILNWDTVYIATGRDYPDALAAAALAASVKSPVLMVEDSLIPSSVKVFFTGIVTDELRVMGGRGVISAETENELQTLPARVVSVEDVSDSVNEKQPYTPPRTVTAALTNGSTQELPVSWNLTAVETYKAGTYVFEGSIPGYKDSVRLTLTIQPIPVKADSLTAEIVQNGSYTLPETVTVTMSDNSSRSYPVIWSSTLGALSKIGTYPFTGSVTGTALKATLTLKVSEEAKIVFADPELEALIRSKTGKTDAEDTIYKSDVLEIASLNAMGYGITDLGGLEYFTNLTSLNLADNALVSAKLVKLQKLTNLRTLKLSGNQLSDILALKSLTGLTYLDLQDNVIADFTSLKYLTRLTTLYLSGNAVTDYSSTRAYYLNLDNSDFNL